MEKQHVLQESSSRYPAALPLATLLNGKYTVGMVLGVGGFSITYLAWDEVLHIPVAIKEFLPAGMAVRDPDQHMLHPNRPEEFRFGLDRFLNEARTLAQLGHYNIVRVRDFFEANGTAYFIMDYYEGHTLEEFMAVRGGRLPEELVTNLFIPLLDGLREAHRKGILHRDIKPANIYLAKLDTGNVRPILLDFGAARFAIGERSKSISMIVTPGYAPYEQYQSKGDLGPWTDVYGAAATMYHACTGTQPPPATDRMMQDELQPPRAFGLSERFAAILTRGMAIHPRDRFQDAALFQDALLGEPIVPAGQANLAGAPQVTKSVEANSFSGMYDPNITRPITPPTSQPIGATRPVTTPVGATRPVTPVGTPTPKRATVIEPESKGFRWWIPVLMILVFGGMGYVAYEYVLPNIVATPEKLYEEYKKEGDTYLANKNYANALRSFEAALEKQDTPYVRERIKMLSTYQTALSEGDDQSGEAWFAKAIESYEKAQQTIPDSPEVAERLRKARQGLNTMTQRARTFAEQYTDVLNSGDSSQIYNLYDDTVDYLGKGTLKREDIKTILADELNQYINASYEVASPIEVEASTGLNRYKVLFDLAFSGDNVTDGVRRSFRQKKRFTLNWRGDRFVVTYERGSMLEQQEDALQQEETPPDNNAPGKVFDF
ncbi:MAG: protein kinase [Rhodothermia bacterium]|nr:protein kinase [Rhodothermia bacterium]